MRIHNLLVLVLACAAWAACDTADDEGGFDLGDYVPCQDCDVGAAGTDAGDGAALGETADGAADVPAGAADAAAEVSAADVADAAEGCGGAAWGCGACLCDLPGRAFRIRTLRVTGPTVPTAPNPAALPEFLNAVWEEDVRRYLLNVLFRVDAVDAAAGTLTLVGGSAWHDVALDALPGPGEPVTVVPTVYHLLPGASAPFTVQLDGGCRFALASAAPTVPFHSGPEDHPLTCTATALGDAVPLRAFAPAATVDAACAGFVSGTFQACLRQVDADQVCTWGPAPDYSDWYLAPDESFADEPGTADFCKRWCGVTSGTTTTKWTSLGGFVAIVGVPLTCDGDGDGIADGYAVSAEFEAEVVALSGAGDAPR